MSMDYLLKALRFFMILDTLHNVIKRTKKLLIKLNFLKDILKEEDGMEERREGQGPSFKVENYKNLDIPKNITAKIHDYLSVNLIYPKHPLMSIMKIKSPFEKVHLNATNIYFEILFNTIKKSYEMQLETPVIRAEVNHQE